jgi:hypothetical protein
MVQAGLHFFESMEPRFLILAMGARHHSSKSSSLKNIQNFMKHSMKGYTLNPKINQGATHWPHKDMKTTLNNNRKWEG